MSHFLSFQLVLLSVILTQSSLFGLATPNATKTNSEEIRRVLQVARDLDQPKLPDYATASAPRGNIQDPGIFFGKPNLPSSQSENPEGRKILDLILNVIESEATSAGNNLGVNISIKEMRHPESADQVMPRFASNRVLEADNNGFKTIEVYLSPYLISQLTHEVKQKYKAPVISKALRLIVNNEIAQALPLMNTERYATLRKIAAHTNLDMNKSEEAALAFQLAALIQGYQSAHYFGLTTNGNLKSMKDYLLHFKNSVRDRSTQMPNIFGSFHSTATSAFFIAIDFLRYKLHTHLLKGNASFQTVVDNLFRVAAPDNSGKTIAQAVVAHLKIAQSTTTLTGRETLDLMLRVIESEATSAGSDLEVNISIKEMRHPERADQVMPSVSYSRVDLEEDNNGFKTIEVYLSPYLISQLTHEVKNKYKAPVISKALRFIVNNEIAEALTVTNSQRGATLRRIADHTNLDMNKPEEAALAFQLAALIQGYQSAHCFGLTTNGNLKSMKDYLLHFKNSVRDRSTQMPDIFGSLDSAANSSFFMAIDFLTYNLDAHLSNEDASFENALHSLLTVRAPSPEEGKTIAQAALKQLKIAQSA